MRSLASSTTVDALQNNHGIQLTLKKEKNPQNMLSYACSYFQKPSIRILSARERTEERVEGRSSDGCWEGRWRPGESGAGCE